MDINAVLTFAGGLLGFAAVVLSLIVQSWKQKDAGSRMVFVHGTLIFLSLLLWASALAVKHIWNFREGAVLLLYLYVFVVAWEFSRREWPLLRKEVLLLVLAICIAMIAILS